MLFIATSTIKRRPKLLFSNQVTANGIKVQPVKAPFTPSLGIGPGDIVVATAGGMTANPTAGGVICDLVRDPASLIDQLRYYPLGAFQESSWVSNAAGLPETEFGIVANEDGTGTILFSTLLAEPLTLLQSLDGLAIPRQLCAFSDSFMY